MLEQSIESGELTEEEAEEMSLVGLNDRRFYHQIMLFRSLLASPILMNLDAALIKNRTENKFIFSDNPVVLDNNLFRDRMNIIGIGNRGVQFFCPINEDLLVMLYDSKCYRLLSDSLSIEVGSERVIESLNDLQFLNANEQIYYSETGREEEMIDALDRLSEYLEPETHSVADITPISSDSEEEIALMQFTNSYTPLLTFIAQDPNVVFEQQRDILLFQQYKQEQERLKILYDGDVTKCLLHMVKMMGANR